MIGQYQQDELDFKTTGHPHGELYEQRQVERGLTLCMQGGYLAVHLPYGLFPRADEPPQTGLPTRIWANKRKAFMANPFLYPFWKK